MWELLKGSQQDTRRSPRPGRPPDWLQMPSIKLACGDFEALHKRATLLELEGIPKLVVKDIEERRDTHLKEIKLNSQDEIPSASFNDQTDDNKLLSTNNDEQNDDDTDLNVPNASGDENELSLVDLAGNFSNLQSRLSTIESFCLTVDLVKDIFEVRSETLATRAMYLSRSTVMATYPLIVLPVRRAFIIPPDVVVDLLRMQGGLPLLDADRAKLFCEGCKKDAYDRKGYHAGFCIAARV